MWGKIDTLQASMYFLSNQRVDEYDEDIFGSDSF